MSTRTFMLALAAIATVAAATASSSASANGHFGGRSWGHGWGSPLYLGPSRNPSLIAPWADGWGRIVACRIQHPYCNK
jgi:hypothetical protein